MEDKKYTVYKHTTPNGKVYIGITQQLIEKRWKNGVFLNEFESIKKASQIVGARESDIVAVCKGRQKTAYGFIWRYKEVAANE